MYRISKVLELFLHSSYIETNLLQLAFMIILSFKLFQFFCIPKLIMSIHLELNDILYLKDVISL